MHKLSIVIVTYNRPKEIQRGIQSCFPIGIEDCEIVIWDNNSDYENRIEVENFCLKFKFPIRYFYSEINLGPGGGKNAAWELCDSEYVFIMDDDAVIGSPDFFNQLLLYMDKNKRVGAAYVNIEEPINKKRYSCNCRYVRNGQVITLAFVGGGHIVRKSVFPQKRLYPQKFMFGSEEVYASLILWNQGYEIHEIPSIRVLHLPTASNRFLGYERDKRILVSAYVIKKLVYPRYILPISFLLFRIRLFKHNVPYKSCRHIVKENYNIFDRHRITLNCYINLVRKFGLINLV